MTPGSQCVVISYIFCSHTLYSLKKNNISDVDTPHLFCVNLSVLVQCLYKQLVEKGLCIV